MTRDKSKAITRRVDKKAFRSRTNDYSLKELQAFSNATYKAYLTIISTKPDAIIAPLRGAEPLVKVMRLHASEEKKSSLFPRTVYPRVGQISIGEYGRVIDQTKPGFIQSQRESEQLKEMSRTIKPLFKNHENKTLHITLIDEVRHGGSITQAVEMIEKIASRKNSPKIKLNIIAIAEKNAYRANSYQALKSRVHVKELVVPRVFTMDSATALFPLVKRKKRLWPFGTKVKLGITKKAMKGRQELLGDIQATRQTKKSKSFFGRSKAVSRLKKIPKQPLTPRFKQVKRK